MVAILQSRLTCFCSVNVLCTQNVWMNYTTHSRVQGKKRPPKWDPIATFLAARMVSVPKKTGKKTGTQGMFLPLRCSCMDCMVVFRIFSCHRTPPQRTGAGLRQWSKCACFILNTQRTVNIKKHLSNFLPWLTLHDKYPNAKKDKKCESNSTNNRPNYQTNWGVWRITWWNFILEVAFSALPSFGYSFYLKLDFVWLWWMTPLLTMLLTMLWLQLVVHWLTRLCEAYSRLELTKWWCGKDWDERNMCCSQGAEKLPDHSQTKKSVLSTVQTDFFWKEHLSSQEMLKPQENK